MSEKVFDRLDLLNIFSEIGSQALVGRFRGWRLKDDRGHDLEEPQPIIHEVFANVVAYYCEKGAFAIIRRTVQVSQEYRLEPWKDKLLVLGMAPQWEAINDVTNNAALVRRVVDIADVWRNSIASIIPEDLAKPVPADAPLLPFDELPTTTDGDELPVDDFDANTSPDTSPRHPND